MGGEKIPIYIPPLYGYTKSHERIKSHCENDDKVCFKTEPETETETCFYSEPAYFSNMELQDCMYDGACKKLDYPIEPPVEEGWETYKEFIHVEDDDAGWIGFSVALHGGWTIMDAAPQPEGHFGTGNNVGDIASRIGKGILAKRAHSYDQRIILQRRLDGDFYSPDNFRAVIINHNKVTKDMFYTGSTSHELLVRPHTRLSKKILWGYQTNNFWYSYPEHNKMRSSWTNIGGRFGMKRNSRTY